MTTGATGQLGLALPVQGELSGTWGDTVNNGITQYTNIAIAATLTLTDDGAVTLANTTGDASATNITSSLTGAGTVTAQFAIVKVTGTLTTAKVVTGPSYSKTYVVVNAATGGIVTFKASGQTGVSIAVGESAWVYYNGTDYVKIASTTSGSAGGSNTQVQYNSSGVLAGSANMTFDGTSLTLANGASIQGLTVGRGAGAVSTNTAVGASALATNTTGGSNIAVGYQSLGYNSAGVTGSENVGIGYQTLGALTSGNNNTALADYALRYTTTGGNNVAVGMQALQSNTTASNNTAVGYQAGYANTTGAYSTLVGMTAGYNNTTGQLTGMGAQALKSNTTGSSNAAFGVNTLFSNTTGNYNTGIGESALFSNTTSSYNTAVGYQAGYSSTGNYNTFVGKSSGYTTTGADNTFIGHQAGYSVTTGSGNAFFGSTTAGSYGAGFLVTTGSKNTILGSYNGNQGGLDIRTASNYIVLSDGDGNPRMYNNGTDWYDAAGKLRAVPQSGSSKTTSYTLATTDVGEYILLGASGAITIPDATFSAGDVVTIFNNTSSTSTITCSITTAYIAGTYTDKATMTLAAAGVATVLFITSTLCVVTGNVT